MSEKEKQVAESLRKNTSGLSAEQMQRLGDIAYGMLLTKELAQPSARTFSFDDLDSGKSWFFWVRGCNAAQPEKKEA